MNQPPAPETAPIASISQEKSRASGAIRPSATSTPNTRPIPANPPAWRERLGGRLPFLIELREYIAREDEEKCDGFLYYLHYLGAHQGFGLNVTELHQSLRDEPSLVMFDGLDEVFDPKVRDRIAREITGFALEYESARVLVTSRIHGFNSRPFDEAGFAIFTLDELEDDQIEAFVNGWFRVAFPERPDEAESRRKHVLETLEHRSAIRALAGNPLAVGMRPRPLEGVVGQDPLLVPGSLAILAATFEGPARGKAIGTWTAWSGIATVLGPAGGGATAGRGAPPGATGSARPPPGGDRRHTPGGTGTRSPRAGRDGESGRRGLKLGSGVPPHG